MNTSLPTQPAPRSKQLIALLIMTALLAVFVMAIILPAKSQYAVIRETSNRQETTATVTENFAFRNQSSYGSNKITVTYKTLAGEPITAKFLVADNHNLEGSIYNVKPGATIQIAYLADRPASSTYFSQFTGNNEYLASIFSDGRTKSPIVYPVVIFTLGAIIVWLVQSLFMPTILQSSRLKQAFVPALIGALLVILLAL